MGRQQRRRRQRGVSLTSRKRRRAHYKAWATIVRAQGITPTHALYRQFVRMQQRLTEATQPTQQWWHYNLGVDMSTRKQMTRGQYQIAGSNPVGAMTTRGRWQIVFDDPTRT